MKLEFSRRILKNILNINFHENPSSGSRVVPCEHARSQAGGRADGEILEANSNFLEFCESA